MEHIFKNVQRVLAPLVGGSDLSYRLLCRKYGAQVTYTEMCIAEYYLNKDNRKMKKFEFDPTDRPLILQLGGNTADPIIELANNPMFEGKIDGVDLNCGCPQGFALEKGYGCALLRDQSNLVNMCDKIVKGIKYPLSVKLRLHDNVEKTIEIMHSLKNVGVCAFTVHGRYYWQKGDKRGKCDWDALKKVREAFPDTIIIGNGDAYSFADANEMIRITNVNASMSGYGALLNPSIFSPIPVPLENILVDYLSIARTHSGLFIDLLRHVGWILKGHSHPLSLQQKIDMFDCKSLPDLLAFLKTLNFTITLPQIEPFEDKVAYPKPRNKQTNREKKRDAKLEFKHQVKRLKKDKHKNNPANQANQNGEDKDRQEQEQEQEQEEQERETEKVSKEDSKNCTTQTSEVQP